MSLPVLVAFAGVLVTAVVTGILAGRCVREPQACFFVWTGAAFGLTVAAAAQAVGFANGFGPVTFRAVQLGAQLIAPLWLAWGLLEAVCADGSEVGGAGRSEVGGGRSEVGGAGAEAARFSVRLTSIAVTVVAGLVLATDSLAPLPFSKAWPSASLHYQSVSHFALDVVQVLALVGGGTAIAVAAVRSRTQPRWRSALPGVVAVGLALLVAVALRFSLPGRSAYPLISVLAAGLIWFGATRGTLLIGGYVDGSRMGSGSGSRGRGEGSRRGDGGRGYGDYGPEHDGRSYRGRRRRDQQGGDGGYDPVAEPGYGTASGHGPQPGDVPQPGYGPQPGNAPQPGYGSQPGYEPRGGYGAANGRGGGQRPMAGRPGYPGQQGGYRGQQGHQGQRGYPRQQGFPGQYGQGQHGQGQYGQERYEQGRSEQREAYQGDGRTGRYGGPAAQGPAAQGTAAQGPAVQGTAQGTQGARPGEHRTGPREVWDSARTAQRGDGSTQIDPSEWVGPGGAPGFVDHSEWVGPGGAPGFAGTPVPAAAVPLEPVADYPSDAKTAATPARPYGRILIFTLLDDKAADFDRLAEQTAEEVRTGEPDTLVYVIHLVPNAPMQRIFYEIYRDRAAFDSHENKAYIQRFVAERRTYVLATNVIELRVKYAKVAPLTADPRPLSVTQAARPQLPPGQGPATVGLSAQDMSAHSAAAHSAAAHSAAAQGMAAQGPPGQGLYGQATLGTAAGSPRYSRG